MKVQKMDYIIDFEVTLNNGQMIYIDTKGQIEEAAQIKSKIFKYKYPVEPIYFIGKLPKYLGNEWVEVTKGKDFRGKLKNKYTSENGKWSRSKPNWNVINWNDYFEFEHFNELFYKWISTNRTTKSKKKGR